MSLGPLGFELRAGEDLVLLGGVVAASAVCFLASSSFLYLSQNTLIGITEKSFPESLTECLRIARRLPDPRAPEASQIFLERGLTQVNRGCRYGASSTLALLNAVTPLIGGVAAGVALLVIDPILTSMLAVAAALWSALLYPLMKRQVKFTDRLAKAKAEFSRESREALRSPFDLAGGTTSTSAAKLAKGMCCNFLKAARERLVESAGCRLMPPPQTACGGTESVAERPNRSPTSPVPFGSCVWPRTPGSFAAPPETRETTAWLSRVV